MSSEFEPVIGLEVHCQLATATKIFCDCPAQPPKGLSVAEVAPNSNVCPICAGHPGTLPVLNRKVVEYAVKAGLATNCKIQTRSLFARKNYFYPDLPKGYQTSQYEIPICENGWLVIPTAKGPKRINIQRIHMEEDAGKNVHMSGFSAVNLNRAGVPLIEIVSGPDLGSPEEAGAYLRALYSIMTFLGICEGNMEEGNFRFDANVSVRRRGETKLGTRAEIKNVNSFRFVEKALEYEIGRQIGVIQSGGRVIQETRSYDSDRDVTLPMRSKEEAEDYRYFPDPDLLPVALDHAWIDLIRVGLPELPHEKTKRYVEKWSLSTADAEQLCSTPEFSQFFEIVVQVLVDKKIQVESAAKSASNWMLGEVSRLLKESSDGLPPAFQPEHLAEIIQLVLNQSLSSTAGKQVLSRVWKTGENIQELVKKEGLVQVSDLKSLEPIIDEVLRKHPDQVNDVRSGKVKVIGFLVGQVMKASGGKANPALVTELIQKKLNEKV